MYVTKAYGYDDLLLEPVRSDLDSRAEPNLANGFFYFGLKVPIFSSPMDTVTEWDMALFMSAHGGMGVIHRYMSIEDQVKHVNMVKANPLYKVGASTGSNGDAVDRAHALIDAGVDLIAIDVAHGHSKGVMRQIEAIRARSDYVAVMSGNIATKQACKDSLNAGAEILRVGIGAGAACTTRLNAGVGVPQLTAIENARQAVDELAYGSVIADGGIKHSGDIVKAFAAGADGVMLGNLLAGYSVAPRPGQYRGMASKDALIDFKGEAVTTEGESFHMDTNLNLDADEAEFNSLVAMVKQGFAYLGANDIAELLRNARWLEVSGLGFDEGRAHFTR